MDHDYLACEHHAFMIASIGTYLEKSAADQAVQNPDATIIRCLLIGLGGGALAMHIVKHFPTVTIKLKMQ